MSRGAQNHESIQEVEETSQVLRDAVGNLPNTESNQVGREAVAKENEKVPNSVPNGFHGDESIVFPSGCLCEGYYNCKYCRELCSILMNLGEDNDAA
jgi:hypothetical protein